MSGFWKNENGSIAVYAAFISVVTMTAGALAVDFGRMSVLRTQMQDAADAGVMAGAAQLDGRDGARDRATSVATNAAAQASGIPADGTALSVAGVTFYRILTPAPEPATTDLEAKFIEITMSAKQVSFLLQPISQFLVATPTASSRALNARAVAQPSPFICEAPPLMLCDPGEVDASMSMSLPANVGRQIRLKEPQAGSSPAAPGNFGLLALPDGSAGASAISAALAAVEPADCYTLDVTTATGSKTNQVKNGINARFDLIDGGEPPAPNVVNYPLDLSLAGDPDGIMGDGDWQPGDYWGDKHGGATLPADLANATRYQVYLYEQGLEFARNGNLTIHPIPDSLSEGYGTVTPPGPDIPAAETPEADSDGDGLVDEADPDDDGVPSQAVASNGFARRIVKVAVVQCVAENVHGSGTYPTNGNFVEMFITQEVRDPPNAAIYGEMVRPLTPTNDPKFHANVRLVE